MSELDQSPTGEALVDAQQRIKDELERGGEPFTPLGIGYERGLRRALELLERAWR